MPAPPKLKDEMHEVFTPGFPINRRSFFKGRSGQVHRILEAVPSPGRHPIIFGQRGVGKTSIVNILSELLPDFLSVKITCDGSDTFKSIWNRVLQKATVTFKVKAFGFSREEADEKTSLAAFLGKDNGLHAGDVAGILSLLTSHAIFIIDEFDRVPEDSVKTGMADLIKNLSDNIPQATLILVGVGDNIGDLVGEHPSVIRNLVQIEMPLMAAEEIVEIVANGADSLGLSIRPDVLEDVSFLAGGFPHYAHLLGLSMCKACVIRDVANVDRTLFADLACSLAVEDSVETYRQAFSKATKASKASRYPQILCACGKANHDENGVFRATDVVEAMQSLFSEELPIQAVVPALQAFTEPDRGSILDKVPFGTRSHYRLHEPMMRPFLRIKGRCLETQ
jgi:energy-coupling factor transporter ATP-binding protein EcfA2